MSYSGSQQRYDFKQDQYSVATRTDSTASNQAGPGRTIDNILSVLALRVEHALGNITGRSESQHVSSSPPDFSSFATCGTDSTASGQLGPGRTLDNMISFAAPRPETILGCLAERLGIGPNAAMRRLTTRMLHINDMLLCDSCARTRSRRHFDSVASAASPISGVGVPKHMIMISTSSAIFHDNKPPYWNQCRSCRLKRRSLLASDKKIHVQCSKVVSSLR
jgi:hypothetical protein